MAKSREVLIGVGFLPTDRDGTAHYETARGWRGTRREGTAASHTPKRRQRAAKRQVERLGSRRYRFACGRNERRLARRFRAMCGNSV
jgi:hypothetical protein